VHLIRHVVLCAAARAIATASPLKWVQAFHHSRYAGVWIRMFCLIEFAVIRARLQTVRCSRGRSAFQPLDCSGVPGAWCIVSDSMIRESDSSAAWRCRDLFTLPQRCESFSKCPRDNCISSSLALVGPFPREMAAAFPVGRKHGGFHEPFIFVCQKPAVSCPDFCCWPRRRSCSNKAIAGLQHLMGLHGPHVRAEA